MSETLVKRLQTDKDEIAPVLGTAEAPIDKVFTVANVISFVRLCMAPAALWCLLSGQDIAAAILFAVAASTDFIDGQIARRTHTVSKIGQLLDPAVDRLLMVCGVIGLMLVQRLPIWIVFVVIIRDVLLFVGSTYLINEYSIRIPVIYPGKVATTFLFVGLAALIINMPLVPGLGWCDFGWLPGFNGADCCWGIWFVYIGLLIGSYTTVHYVRAGVASLSEAKGGR